MNAWSRAVLIISLVSSTASSALAQGAQVVEYVGGKPVGYTAATSSDISVQAQSQTQAQAQNTERVTLVDADETKYATNLGKIVSPAPIQPMCVRPSANPPRIREFGAFNQFKSDLDRTLASSYNRQTTSKISARSANEKPSKVALGSSVSHQ